MKYFSMFSGIGGFELGIGDRGECVGYSEIDKYAIKVYERHFNHENYGDATGLDTARLPDFDFVVGGFPCQAFSVAGRRKGFADTRGTLFYEIARVLKDKRPRHLLLENVKGLLSHDEGKTFQTILGVLADIGYRVEWQVLNSKDFGVPQNRERVFIIGHLRDECGRKVFPIGTADEVRDEPNSIKEKVYAGTQTARQYASWNGNFIDVIGSLDSPTWQKRHESIRRVHGTSGISPTIPTGTGGGVMTKIKTQSRIRRLTPVECERLMAYPDNWTALDNEGGVISHTQRYKMCGNGVVSNVVAAVIDLLTECFEPSVGHTVGTFGETKHPQNIIPYRRK